MRELKHHEKKLLRKVNFFDWKRENNLREISVIRKYHVQDRDDYQRYNRIVGRITSLVSKIQLLPPKDTFRIKLTEQLLDKLYFCKKLPNGID